MYTDDFYVWPLADTPVALGKAKITPTLPDCPRRFAAPWREPQDLHRIECRRDPPEGATCSDVVKADSRQKFGAVSPKLAKRQLRTYLPPTCTKSLTSARASVTRHWSSWRRRRRYCESSALPPVTLSRCFTRYSIMPRVSVVPTSAFCGDDSTTAPPNQSCTGPPRFYRENNSQKRKCP